MAGVLFVALLALRFVALLAHPDLRAHRRGDVARRAAVRACTRASSGVALGLLVNVYAPRPRDIARVQVLGGSFLVDPSPERALAAQQAAAEAVSPNERLQLRIQPWSSYVIVPFFVLANAGVVLTGETLAAAFTSPITWGIIVGLTVGKLIGVTAGTWVALRTGIGRVPDTLRWGQIVGGAGLAGIGFTVALFITELALDGPGAGERREDRHPRRLADGGVDRLADLPAGGGAGRPVRPQRPAGAAAAPLAPAGLSARRPRVRPFRISRGWRGGRRG